MAITIDKKLFKQRWQYFPINQTANMMFDLFNESPKYKNIMDDFYRSEVRRYSFERPLRNYIRRKFYDIYSPEEEALWNHRLTKNLFEIWAENIEGFKQGWRVDTKERIEFFDYLFNLLEIAHNPKLEIGLNHPPTYDEEIIPQQSWFDRFLSFMKKWLSPEKKEEFKAYKARTLFENFQNMGFGLKVLRPNNQVHIYLGFPFTLRPLKKIIHQYFDMAVITGDFEVLLRRFPPWHFMLSINAFPGQRTSLDFGRGMDFKPIIYKIDMKYNAPIYLENIQTRSNNRLITCPVVYDPKIEAQRKGEIDKKQQLLNSQFPSPAYIFNYDLGRDGNIYFVKDGKLTEPIQMFGTKRSNFIQDEAELNLLKAIPRPGSKSGLVIRFNLLHPIVPLIEGINGKREVSLEEIACAWKSLDILEGDFKKDPKDRMGLDAIVDEVFSNPNPFGVKEETASILREVERLRVEDPTEETAWRYLIGRFLEGKGRPVLQAICLRLATDAFDVVFSLWPLITGNEITITETGDIQVVEKPDKPREEKRMLLPFLEVLKREIEYLLKNVFTKYLDISAATNRARSEPKLAGMIVEYCLNVKLNEDKFKKKLKDHLIEHYKRHFEFLKEYLKGQPPTVLHRMLKVKVKPDRSDVPIEEIMAEITPQIEADVEGIMELIYDTRTRLYTPSISCRLLCFIDPYSIDVQIGDFEYSGPGLKEEEQFILDHEQRQYELAQAESQKRLEVEKFNIERKGNKEIFDGKRVVLKVQEEFYKAEAESVSHIKEAQVHKAFSEAKFQAIEALREGKIKEYALISMIKAHQELGYQGVEKILKENPNLVMAVDPHLHEHQEVADIKHKLVHMLEKDPSLWSPVTIAMLLSEDFKDIVASEKYQKFLETMTEIAKIRPGFMGGGMWGGMGGMGGGGGTQHISEQNVDQQNVKRQTIQRNQLPPPDDKDSKDEKDDSHDQSDDDGHHHG